MQVTRRLQCLVCAATLMAVATTARSAEVILYDFFDFGGASITLNGSAPDLDEYDFDNDVESIRVISGTWSFHRDDDFQNNNGPAIILGPGAYPNIEAIGFPADRMSSVQLIGETQPPPSQACVAPYQVADGGGGCVFTCATGTFGDAGSGQCVCLPGYVETGTDAQGRRICGPASGAAPVTDEEPVQPPPMQETHWIRLDGLQINGGAPSTDQPVVTLTAQVSTSASLGGAPIQYRAAESYSVFVDQADLRQFLAAAPWQPYRDARAFAPRSPITLTLSASPGPRYVYFQVRSGVSAVDGSWSTLESEIRMAQITVAATAVAPGDAVAPQTQTYEVAGGTAYLWATQEGFTFRSAAFGPGNPLSYSRCDIDPYPTQGPDAGQPFMTLAAYALQPHLTFETTCMFEVFLDGLLLPSWSLDEADWRLQSGLGRVFDTCSGASVLRINPGNPRDVAFRVTITLNQAQLNCKAMLTGLTLTGPANADWRDAF